MENGLAEQGDINSLDFFVQKRNGKKRDYVFDYGKSRKCSHASLKELARGGNWYRCEDCNYAFFIQSATQWPLHFLPIMAMFEIMNFSKEFGADSLMEVLRRPIGQTDGTPHKPVLPDGMSFVDVLQALEGVDINSDDGGAEQLKSLLSAVWEGQGQKALPDNHEERDDGSNGNHGEVPALPKRNGRSRKGRDTGKS